jgi:SMODS-associated and fused to various effectors sensor domain
MARSIVARRQGDDFQARLFWLNATALLDPHSPVTGVTYEAGPKGFDDITVEYDPAAAPQDHQGKPFYRKYIQCKWHTTAGVFGYADLTAPAFIGAERFSLLDKVYQAQRQYAPDGFGCRFELVTNWRLKPDDPLLDLVRKESGALDLDRFFDGTSDTSRMGRVRKLWRDHLRLHHGSLELALRPLAILEAAESSLAGLRERLDDRFAAVGMKRVPPSEAAFLYDDLAAKLLAQRRVAFDRDSFRDMARREKLLVSSGTPTDALTIGIRSFMHPIDPLEQRCQRTLNLVPYFDHRYIRNEVDWHGRVLPELREFVLKAARSSEHLRLVLDAHVSLAFAVGALLNVKSGKRIEVEQRTGGRRLWSMGDQLAESAWPRFEFDEEIVKGHGDELALAVGLTHDVSDEVRSFVKGHATGIRWILHCRPQGGASQQSVLCGRHAWMLSEAAVQQVRRLRESAPATGPLHVFIAGPNGFVFFLGQHQQALGPAAGYEWDFDGQRGGGYSLGLLIGG